MEGHELVVLFGSETGTAEQEARLFGLQAQERGYNVKIHGLDEFKLAQLPSLQHVVFFVSTTGQGDPPKNMTKFWTFLLHPALPNDSLATVRFAVFGFGNSSYAKYNVMGRMLNQRLLQLGANEIVRRGLGDDQSEGGYNLALVPWKKMLFTALQDELGIEDPNNLNTCYSGLQKPPQIPLKVQVIPQGTPGNAKTHMTLVDAAQGLTALNGREFGVFEVESNQRNTAPDHDQDVRLLMLKSLKSLNYRPGDVCSIAQGCSPDITSWVLDYFKLNVHDTVNIWLKVSAGTEQQPPSISVTAYQLVTYLLDFQSTPRFFFFKLLQFYCDQSIYQEKIQEMEYEDYFEYAIRQRRSLVEILAEFKGIKVPLDICVAFLGWNKPRDYSISSSPLTHPATLMLTIGLVKYETNLGRIIEGVCSQYVRRLEPGHQVLATIKKGTLELPEDPKTPVLLIGPGTGIAPIISYLLHRAHLSQQHGITGGRHRTFVFFGCRNKEKDFLHRDLLEGLQKNEQITLFTAFSRDQDQKVYVQHLLEQQSFRLSAMFKEHKDTFRIFVCGKSGDMPKAIEKRLRGMFEPLTVDYDALVANKRIQFETWG